MGDCHMAAAVAQLPASDVSSAASQHQFSPMKAPLWAAEPAAGTVMCPPAFEGMSELKVEFQGHIMRLEQLIEHHGLREADPTGGRSACCYISRAAAPPITAAHWLVLCLWLGLLGARAHLQRRGCFCVSMRCYTLSLAAGLLQLHSHWEGFSALDMPC